MNNIKMSDKMEGDWRFWIDFFRLSAQGRLL